MQINSELLQEFPTFLLFRIGQLAPSNGRKQDNSH